MIGAAAPPAGTDDGIVGRFRSASEGVVVAVGSVVVACACTDETLHDNSAHPIRGDQMSRLRWARIVMEPSCHPGTGPMVGWKKSCTDFDRQVQPLASDWHIGVMIGGDGGGEQPTVQVGVGGMVGGGGLPGGSPGGVGGVGGSDGGVGGSDGGFDGGSDGGSGGAAGGSVGGVGGRLIGITGGESGGTPNES